MNEPKQVGKGIFIQLGGHFRFDVCRKPAYFAAPYLHIINRKFIQLVDYRHIFYYLVHRRFYCGRKIEGKGVAERRVDSALLLPYGAFVSISRLWRGLQFEAAPLSFRLFGSQHAGRGFRGQSAGEPCIKAAKRERMSAPFSQCPQASFVIHIRNKCSFLKQ